MKLGGVLDFSTQTVDSSSNKTVAGKVVAVQSPNENLYTVQLGNQNVELTVKYTGESLKPGDALEIPLALITKSLQGGDSGVVVPDSATFSTTVLDKLINLLTADASNSTNANVFSAVENKTVQAVIDLIAALPEEKQKQILESVLVNIAKLPNEGDPVVFLKSNEGTVTNSPASILDEKPILALLLDQVLPEVSHVLKSSTAETKAKILTSLSTIASPIVDPESSMQGIFKLRSIPEKLLQFSIVAKEKNELVANDAVLKSKGGETGNMLSAAPVKDSAKVNEMGITVPKVVQLKNELLKDESLWLVRYPPEKILKEFESSDTANVVKGLDSIPAAAIPFLKGGASNNITAFPYERIIPQDKVQGELKQLIAIRFPNVAAVLSDSDYGQVARTDSDIPTDVIAKLDQKLAVVEEGDIEKPYLKAVASQVMQSIANSENDALVQRVLSQIEPVTKIVISVDTIIRSLLNFQSATEASEQPVPSNVLIITKELEKLFSDIVDQFSNMIESSQSGSKDISAKNILQKIGDSWGLFFESRLNDSSQRGLSDSPELGLKQKLQQLSKEITSTLVSQTLKVSDESESPVRSFLKQVGRDVVDTIQKIEGAQTLSKPQEIGKEREQIIWVPVHIGGEWTRLGVEFRREHRGKGYRKKLGNRVNIHMELRKMGRVSAELDLDANKQLRISLSATKKDAVTWFKEHEQEIYTSLENSNLKSVILSIGSSQDGGDSQQKRDSFQVSG